jgi:predicted nucleotide-binding protein
VDRLSDLARRFQEQDELVGSQRALLEWQEQTAEIIEGFDGREISNRFRLLYSFDQADFSGDYLDDGIEKYHQVLTAVIEKIPASDITRRYEDDVRVPLDRIDELLERIRDIFRRSSASGGINHQTAEDGLRRWKDTAYKALTDIVGEEEAGEIYSMRAGHSWGDEYGSLEQQFAMYVTYLLDLKDEIQKYPDHLIAQPAASTKTQSSPSLDPRIFIVHGHGTLKDSVARVVSALGLEAVILQEQPGAGRTLIEKVEKYSVVGYAVVLLVPDDVGGKRGEEQRDRARQNVVFELGYFVGKIGRGRVCVLYSEGVEMPSDYFGVEYVSLDSKGAWRYRLGRELREAGYAVDLNLL